MEGKSLLFLFAELMSNTAVPRSMKMLGAGNDTWDEISNRLGSFGYLSAEGYDRLIKKAIAEELLGAFNG